MDFHAIEVNAVTTVTRLVTSNDELVASLEGIECMMIESMYFNNEGSLRKAWLINRKAMTVAQMIGLDKGAKSGALTIEPETHDRIHPDYMWFRLILSDRYLSLMLGLPQGTLENGLGNLAEETGDPMERMERMMSVVSGHILRQSSTQKMDVGETMKIDQMLQEAAALMPPQWWLMGTGCTARLKGSQEESFDEAIRVANQFAYYHLLVQLHLPYVMRVPSGDMDYSYYSKVVAANASRALLERFISFRKLGSSSAYCRGIDFIAFIASITLCLSHVEARRQRSVESVKGYNSAFQSMHHQRPVDRGLLECFLEIVDKGTGSHDAIANKISDILKPLLAIENDSAQGNQYRTSATLEVHEELQCPQGFIGERVNVLQIQIPYFGTINIEYQPSVPDTREPTHTITGDEPDGTAVRQVGGQLLTISLHQHMTPSTYHAGQQRRDTTTNTPGYGLDVSQPANSDWQAVPSYLDLSPRVRGDQELSLDTTTAEEVRLLVPGLDLDVDDWALQGVDTALFSALTQRSQYPTEGHHGQADDR
ncbi:hypothetical protein jhhlp_008564 [Lomentospora prolificans]|uniref:Transcription factor domain-containing protein n=1 Tax=Lomentospora prolificans TaxID=41688 RepID=A0A2N3MYE6_9PEZI|nr:hypothetical protein jhhlp_008564 [Lomentospora prolificans]